MKSIRAVLYKSLFVIAVLIAEIYPAAGQTGSYFMAHYNPAEQNFDNTSYAIYQGERGIMHIANRQGVIHFDGNSWWLTPTPFSIFCLTELDGEIFAGGREGFGSIASALSDEMEFMSIDTINRNIIDCGLLNGVVYYMNEQQIFRFDPKGEKQSETVFSTKDELLDMTIIDNEIYLSMAQSGLMLLKEDGLHAVEINVPAADYFIRQSPSGKLLHFTAYNELYVTTANDSLWQLMQADTSLLADQDVTEVTWVSDSLIAVSTLSGGLIFVNATTGELEQIVDYNSGLPDNEITTIYSDITGELWAIHPYGITVVSPGLPLRSYNHYPGLNGILSKVLSYNNQLVLGTSVGVFKLVKKRNTRQSVIYDRVRVKIDNTAQEPTIEEPIEEKKGLFRRKKNKKIEEKVAEETTPAYRYVYQKRIVEVELSVDYEFEAIKGINSKTVSLLVYNNQLLAGTVHGLYQIVGDTAYNIAEVPVISMYGLPDQNLLIVSTIDQEVKTMTFQGGQWRETNMLMGLRDYIVQITLDPENNIWLCGADSLYRLVIEKSTLRDVEVYKIDNPHYERVYSVNHQNQILFINSSGYYTYKNRQIVSNDEIASTIGLARKYVQGANGELLINTGNRWYGANKDIMSSLNFLSLFKDPQSVAADTHNNYWVITASNDLYKIDASNLELITGNETIYLKEVRTEDGRVSPDSELEIREESGSLIFEFASPDYSGIYRKQYQYRLSNAVGIQSEWSNWSTGNNVISYQFLPQGSYTLEARFRNALGKVVAARPYKFSVVPPYWKRPWFYIAEVLFFGSLLFLSFYLNRGKGKYSFISRLLGFLTLILIVQFFQTVAEYKFETNDSPVINFFIQAFIALMVLPVEGFLRKRLTLHPKEKDIEIEV